MKRLDLIDLDLLNEIKIDDHKLETNTNIEVILLGEEKIGKTQIINQLIDKKFNDNYIKTLSANYEYKTIKIEEEIIKSKNLSIYDLPGAKQFRSINNTFLKSSDIILLVYDITNIESFIELYNWNELLTNKENILKCVIGNKNDLIEKREISQEDGKNFANKIEALFFETNAKDYINICEIFTKIVTEYSLLYEKKKKKKSVSNSSSNSDKYLIKLRNIEEIEEKKKKKRKGCEKCVNSFSDKIYLDPCLFKLKIKNSNKNINEDNSKNEKKQIKEMIKYKNGNIKEIYNNNIEDEEEEYCIFKFQNGGIFEGKIDKEKNKLIDGLLYKNNMEINIYDKKIVNLITALIITNSKIELNQDSSNENYFELDNNFVIKVNLKDENIILDENILINVNIILFIFKEIDENCIIKIKSLHNKILKINKENIIIGIIACKNSIKNKEILNSIQELSKSLNIFFEEEEEEIEEFEMKDFLNNIKNKYLNHYENEVIENEEGTYFGGDKNGKKEGYGIMLYENSSIYFGEWENDQKNGNGILFGEDLFPMMNGKWKNDELISGKTIDILNFVNEGNFFDDEIYEGKFSYFDFLKYEGTLKGEDLYGMIEIKNGNIYEGKCNNFIKKLFDNVNGEGIIKYNNNDIYKGKWNDFKKNGKGIIYTEDGDIFESEWENDIIIGNWMLKSNNGDIYIGENNIYEDKEDEENFEIKFEIDEDNFEIKFEIDEEKYNLEEKINIIEEYMLGIGNLENFEINDDELIKVEYDIQYIYKIWKIGQNISKYINEGKKILFFKEFIKSSINSNKNFKKLIINKIERLIMIINYAKKYAIFSNKKILFMMKY